MAQDVLRRYRAARCLHEFRNVKEVSRSGDVESELYSVQTQVKFRIVNGNEYVLKFAWQGWRVNCGSYTRK